MDSIGSSSSVLSSSHCLVVRDTLFSYVASQRSQHMKSIKYHSYEMHAFLLQERLRTTLSSWGSSFLYLYGNL